MALKFAPKKTLTVASKPSVKATPTKPISTKPVIASKEPQKVSKASTPIQRPVTPRATVGPLKTTLDRPCLRAFECLVNVEHAMKSLQGIGIFVGEDAEKQRTLHEQLTQDLIQLHLSYKTYWRQVMISTGEKE